MCKSSCFYKWLSDWNDINSIFFELPYLKFLKEILWYMWAWNAVNRLSVSLSRTSDECWQLVSTDTLQGLNVMASFRLAKKISRKGCTDLESSAGQMVLFTPLQQVEYMGPLGSAPSLLGCVVHHCDENFQRGVSPAGRQYEVVLKYDQQQVIRGGGKATVESRLCTVLHMLVEYMRNDEERVWAGTRQELLYVYNGWLLAFWTLDEKGKNSCTAFNKGARLSACPWTCGPNWE